MNPPKPFTPRKDEKRGFSQCIACDKWRRDIAIFEHEGRQWNLCRDDYGDYWENTDELLDDYKAYT